MYVTYAICMPGVCRGKKREPDPWELELLLVVNCCVDAVNPTGSLGPNFFFFFCKNLVFISFYVEECMSV